MKKKHKKEAKAEKNKRDGSYMKERELKDFIFLLYQFNCASSRSSCIGKLAVILKLGLRNISKRITSLIVLNIYTPMQHALTGMILFLLK